MMKSNLCACLISSVLLVVFSAVSHAKVTITPSVTVREQYNDNIFLTDSGEEDDYITNVTPRIVLEYYPNKYLDLNLDYSLHYRFYADHDGLDDTSLKETQNAEFHSQLRPLNRVFIDVDDSYGRVPVDAREKVATDNEFTNKTERNIFRVSPYVEVPFTSTVLSRFGYRYRDTWYEADDGNSSKSNSLYASVIKKFPISLTLSLNYDFTSVRPEITNDYDKHQVYGSINYRVVSNLEIWGSFGEAYLDYVDVDNEKSTFWNVGSEYNISGLGDSSVSITYSQQTSESESSVYRDSSGSTREELSASLSTDTTSVSAGVSEIQSLSMSLILRKYVELNIHPRYTVTEEIKTDREDKVIGVDISFHQPLSSKLAALIDGFWEKQEFMPQDYTVRNYSVSGSFEYRVSRYITAGTGYRYNNRDSDLENDDYHNNIVWLETKVTY